jgi:dCMP deaminase
MKPKFITMYMEIAGIIAKQSSAKRLQVGAIVVKDDRIISIGYNGMPAGWTNECEEKEWIIGNIPQKYKDDQWIFKEEDSGAIYRMRSKPEVIHAEANAIAKLARGSESGEGSTMFLTHAPCLDCAKQMYTAGINKVYFREQYRDTLGIDFLEQCGVEVEQCNIGENT